MIPVRCAFRFGGFGTHEIVIYYDLLRHLLGSCRRRLAETAGETTPCADLEFGTLGDFLTTEVPRLERLRDDWLDAPDAEFHGRTPRSVIDHERARIPEAVSGDETVIDHDCPLCQMNADMPGPVFWHLDGCNMDPDFAFSLHGTHEEWEEEQRDYEEFNRRFESKREEEKRLGVEYPGAGYGDPDFVWSRSFVAGDTSDAPLELRLFTVGSHLAELIVDLKQPTEDRALIDRLGRDFGNLRDVTLTADMDRAAALVEPVLDRFRATLDAVAQARMDLVAKCADLQQRLSQFLETPSDVDQSRDPFDDSDRPF